MRLPRTFGLALMLAFCAAVARPALAQAEEETIAEEGPSDDDEVIASSHWGLGARFRYLFIPESVLELFLDHATHLSSYSIAAELSYRLQMLDIVMSVDYSNGNAEDGLYLEKNDNPGNPAQSPDYTEFDGFGMVSLDATFVWHVPLHDRVQIRGGAGLGVGLLVGTVYQTTTLCPIGSEPGDLDDPNFCMQVDGTRAADNDIPKIIPVVNLLLGVRFKVTPDVSVNLEGGFRNAFFFGAGAGYFF